MQLNAILAFLIGTCAAHPLVPKQQRVKTAANAAYVNRLVRGATATTASTNIQLGRKLQEGEDVDISSYFVTFQECQFGVVYDMEQPESYVLYPASYTERSIVFRLCGGDCSSSCDENFVEYRVDIGTYLEATVAYYLASQGDTCDACKEEYYALDSESDRPACLDDCPLIEFLELNGYLDAADYSQCTMIGADNDARALYAGPVCGSSDGVNGNQIKIGVFYDDECNRNFDSSKNPDDYVFDREGNSAKLWYYNLEKTYDGACISCPEDTEDAAEGVCDQLLVNADNCDNCEQPARISCEYIFSGKKKDVEAIGITCESGGTATTTFFDPTIEKDPKAAPLTVAPSIASSSTPSDFPSLAPSDYPSLAPSDMPSDYPSLAPTTLPVSESNRSTGDSRDLVVSASITQRSRGKSCMAGYTFSLAVVILATVDLVLRTAC